MGTAITIEIIEQINQYLKGTLPEDEKLVFEQKLVEDDGLREEMIIQKQLFLLQGVVTNDLPFSTSNERELRDIQSKLQSEEYQILSNKIRKAGIETQNKSNQHKNYWQKYAVAASIVLVFSLLFYFNSQNSLENYYHENVNWEELPSFIEKGNAENDFQNGENFFKNKDYKNAITTFKKINGDDKLYPFALMYLGASYDLNNENDKAIQTFQELSRLTSFEEHSKGYWYELLIYLKQNNLEKAKELKAVILEDNNNYNYIEVQKIEL
jgi:tetratricopeptide (TPR) repeat protein